MKNKSIILLLAFLPSLGTVCAAQTAQITGVITNPFGDPVTDVLVNLIAADNSQQTITTDETGNYTFMANVGETYTIACSREDAPLNGVSTFDLVLGLQHILHTQSITNPYLRIAADVNNSGTISVADLWKMRQLILGMDTTWDIPTWQFVSEQLEDTAPIQIELRENQIIDFVGVKTGDLNGNSY